MKNGNDIYKEIDSEIKFVELLGYSIIETDNPNEYLIIDTNNKEVGFIRKQKAHIKNWKKTRSNVFGYHMLIESDDINYDCIRRDDHDTEKFNYEFYVKSPNNTPTYIHMVVSDKPYLYIESKEYGSINFMMDLNELYLNCPNETDNCNSEESVVVKIGNEPITNESRNSYIYNSYYKYSLTFPAKNGNSAEMKYTHDSEFYHYDKNSVLFSKTYSNSTSNDLIRLNNISKGSIHEAVIKHALGVKAFSHFRFLVNSIIPFKDDVILAMLEKRGLNEPLFQLFIPDYKDLEKKDSIKNLCKKKNAF